jgi:hypothetical protein
MAEFIATSNSFFKLGMAMIKRHKKLETYKETTEQERVFKLCFGVSALVLTQCWNLLIKHSDERLIQPPKPQQKKLAPKHLLWACFFLKTSVNSSMAETSEKTFRHWAWTVIRLISDLEPYVVSEND